MASSVENPIRSIKHHIYLAAAVALINTLRDTSNISMSDEVLPIPTPVPKPFEERGWLGNRHMIWRGNLELAETKFCGGEQFSEENRQAVLFELLVRNVNPEHRVELEIWDHKDTPPTRSRFPATIKTTLGQTRAFVSEVLPPGRYSVFVQIEDKVEQLTDQSIFECIANAEIKE